MSYGPIKVFTTTIASGASTSSAIDLGKSHSKLAVHYDTMSTGTTVVLFASPTLTGTYTQVNQLVPSTATVAYQPVQIATAVSAGWAVLENMPFQYIQLVTTAVVSGGVAFTVLGAD